MRIVIIDKIARFTTEQVKELQKFGEVLFTPLNKEALDKFHQKFYGEEVILVPDPDVFDWKITDADLSKFSKLKSVCLSTTAFDYIDLNYCNKHDIIVTNSPQYSTEAVAEYAIWMMLSLARKHPLMLNRKMKSFDQTALQTETKQKIMGIIGLGNIGNRIAEYGDRMGMRVIYWSRSKKDTFFQTVSLNKLLSTANFIFPTFAFNKKTKKLLTKENLNLIKKDSYVISIIDKNAVKYNYLIKQVNAKKLAGFAFETTTLQKCKQYEGNIFATPPFACTQRKPLNDVMNS